MRKTSLMQEVGSGLLKGLIDLSLLVCLVLTIQISCSGGGGGGGVGTPQQVVAPTGLAYSQNQATYTKGTAIANNTPSNSGGAVVSYSVSPALPAGINISAATGIISGLPTTVSATATYTITATNPGGSATAILNITVNDATPSALAYSSNPVVYVKGTAIAANTPSSSGGAVVSYAVSPALPAGLSLSNSSGVISGTPTASTATANYVVTATNTGGSTTASLSITVIDIAVPPSGLAYSTNPAIYAKGSAIAANTPSSSGGAVVSYAVNPALPAGLSMSPETGIITGTPTAITATADYVVTATNPGGSTTASLSITVVDIAVPPSGLTYSTNPAIYTKGIAIAANTPSSSGGAVVSYAVNPALPTGLGMSPGTGIITGTPTDISAQATYTVTATNPAGSATASLSIKVNDVAPGALTYTYTTRRFTTGNAIQTDSPSSSGGAVVSYSVLPPLPAGLNLNATTGLITGTPTAITAQTTYTVTATNSGGSAAVGLNFTVVPPGPSITAQPQSTSALVGGTATFHVTATGSGPLTYQWQRNDSNIAVGATSSNYTTPVLAIGDNGSRYRALVFDSYGSQDTSVEALLTVTAPATQVRGTNLVGMEMSYTDFSQADGPIAGTNYPVYDNRLIDYYVSKHVSVLRILFTWEGMQSSLFGPIPAANVGNYKAYFDNFKHIVDYATSKGITVVIEPWQANAGGGVGGAMYRGVLVGTPGVSANAFADFWSKMAMQFSGNQLVSFGLVNEPNNMSTMSWWASAQAAITAIRATGSNQWIYVPGNGWTAASSWTSNWYDTAAPQRSNAYGWLNANGAGSPISDPLNLTAVEVHTYLDSSEGGGTTEITSLTAARDHLAVTVDEARAHGYKVLLGEIGFYAGAVANDASTAPAVWANFISYFQANPDVLKGYAWWAAGSPGWWDDVAANGGGHFSITPTNGATFTGDTVNMLMIQANF